MKILAIKSSPRANGNSNTMIEKILQGAEEKGDIVFRYDLNEMDYKGCQACRVCKEKGIYCTINDDLQNYWDKFKTADVIVLGSPNYMGTITGTLKIFIDRHYCAKDVNMKPKIEPGKKAILVISQGNADEAYYKENYKFLEKYLGTLKMDVETIIHSGHTPAEKNEELMKKAYELGKNL